VSQEGAGGMKRAKNFRGLESRLGVWKVGGVKLKKKTQSGENILMQNKRGYGFKKYPKRVLGVWR